jgi:Predicted membrane protein
MKDGVILAVSLIRTILLYMLIIFSLKIMGKRQISELQTSELVVTLLVSNIATIPMQNPGQPLISGAIPIIALVIFEVVVSVIMLKNSKFRKFLCGSPIVVIDDGKIMQNELKTLRMTVEDLSEELRQLDVFSLEDVSYAIVETNGKLSVLKKPDKQPPDASSLGIEVPDEGIDAVVVSDGEISDFSLSLCGLSKEWIEEVVQNENIKISDIFIMTANKNKDYNIIEKEI